MSRDTHAPTAAVTRRRRHSAAPLGAASLAAALLLTACAVPDEPAAGEVASALAPEAGQGTSYQGTSYQGATHGDVALADGSLAGAALVVWKAVGTGKGARWQQRFPDRICTWNYLRTIREGCAQVDLDASPSPLAGSTWPATFRRPDGTIFEGKVQIGASTTQLGVARSDIEHAMHPLTGASTCALASSSDPSSDCDHPDGCRENCDLWLYDVRLVDTDGALLPFCPAGERAIAVAGTYSATGERTADPDRFTFACTNGTIAKCTRWGYRPFGEAADSSGAVEPLEGYHQACVRAAMADYCANGTSFTRNGTLIDIYDYDPYASAFVGESSFDRHGATAIDEYRYQDLGGVGGPTGCPGRFSLPTAPVPPHDHAQPAERVAPSSSSPQVSVDSTTMCAHSEHVIGRKLHRRCSSCTMKMWAELGPTYAHCTRAGAGGSWDAACVAAAQQCAAGQRMASHGECTVGAGLSRYDSGCTLAVCLEEPSCCTASGWTAACVSAANARCKGGEEDAHGLRGFCGAVVQHPGDL